MCNGNNIIERLWNCSGNLVFNSMYSVKDKRNRSSYNRVKTRHKYFDVYKFELLNIDFQHQCKIANK